MFVRVMNTSLKYITKIQLAPNSKHYLAKKSSKFKNSRFFLQRLLVPFSSAHRNMSTV